MIDDPAYKAVMRSATKAMNELPEWMKRIEAKCRSSTKKEQSK